MKKEVAFFKDRRAKLANASAADLIKLYRFLGYTDAEIVAEMRKLKEARKPTYEARDEREKNDTV